MMPDTIQLGEYSTGSGMDGTPHRRERRRQPVRPVLLLRCWCVEPALQLARQRVQRAEPRGLRNLIHFSPAPAGEFCFASWPFQPPRIRPTSSNWLESAIYFLLFSDLVSHNISKSSLSVSILRMANCTDGIFSCRGRNTAVTTASSTSTNNESIRTPNE